MEMKHLQEAINILNRYRQDDKLSKTYSLIYQHELAEKVTIKPDRLSRLTKISKDIEEFLCDIENQNSAKDYIYLLPTYSKTV
jgi:hypothetical protein